MLGDLLGELTQSAVKALKATDAEYVVCGGVAIALLGRGRSTRDLDVLAILSDNDISRFIEAARAHGFSHHERADCHHLDDVTLYRFWLPIRDTGLSTSLGLQIGKSDYHREVLRRGKEISLANVSLRIVTPEDLVLTKISAYRPIDRADAIDVATLNELDEEYLSLWAERLGLQERLRDVLETSSTLSSESNDVGE